MRQEPLPGCPDPGGRHSDKELAAAQLRAFSVALSRCIRAVVFGAAPGATHHHRLGVARAAHNGGLDPSGSPARGTANDTAAAARVTGDDMQSLRNMVYVAGRFEGLRRREEPFFSLMPNLPGTREAQEVWLDRAEAGALSLRSLRSELRHARRRAALRAALADAWRQRAEVTLISASAPLSTAARRRRELPALSVASA
jgi:hypothetical protein